MVVREKSAGVGVYSLGPDFFHPEAREFATLPMKSRRPIILSIDSQKDPKQLVSLYINTTNLNRRAYFGYRKIFSINSVKWLGRALPRYDQIVTDF